MLDGQSAWPRLPSLLRLSGALPVVVGAFTFAFVWVGRGPSSLRMDFDVDYLWTAGHAVWSGKDPYAAVMEQVRRGILHYPYYYPGTAAVLFAPFGAFPHRFAVSLFTGLGMALLAWSLKGWRRWAVVSAPALEAILIGQWSPWLTAAIGLPWLGGVWIAKPTIGLSLMAGWPSRRAAGAALLVLAVSLAVLPDWPNNWLSAIQGAPHYKAPIQRFGGALLLLALLRWRKPEARLLGMLAIMPHTTGVYEQLPLFLIPQTSRAFVLLMSLSYLAAVLVYTQQTFQPSVADTLAAQWPYFLVLVYLPALAMTLWPERKSQASASQVSAGEPTKGPHKSAADERG